MNLKSQVAIEVVKGERTFTFTMPIGAPYGEAYDACFEALKTIAEMTATALDQSKRPTEVAQDAQ